ncbi:MAG: orotidine 5'-phosphate decarboxylase / HUMPS family protein, partial [Candidatus Uhrbacteria bacterium]|nr:orotidine 5'-phosphate decarboxylase / HUMPS family protein [Candidatus Uhrbacteria bacterium]
MSHRPQSQLDHKKSYLQIALNSTLEEARKIIFSLPKSDRIIIEAGTPLIKQYGVQGIRAIRGWADTRFGTSPTSPYIVADMKTMDRGETEVLLAKNGGANAVIALGCSSTETLNAFIENCENNGMDAMIDMMDVEFPLSVLRSLKKIPPVVLLHRGVDEERFNKEKQIPLYEIRRIKGNYNIMISIAGGDTLREVQSSVFNDA